MNTNNEKNFNYDKAIGRSGNELTRIRCEKCQMGINGMLYGQCETGQRSAINPQMKYGCWAGIPIK